MKRGTRTCISRWRSAAIAVVAMVLAFLYPCEAVAMGDDSVRRAGARRLREGSDGEPAAARTHHVRHSRRALRDSRDGGGEAARALFPRMTFEDAWRLLDYHYWARDRMWRRARKGCRRRTTRRISATVSDRCATPWSTCMPGSGSGSILAGPGIRPRQFPNPEDFPDLDAIRDPWKSQEQKVRAVRRKPGDAGMARVIEYRTFKGDPRQSVFWQMLQHVVNHATYHRGQVTTMLRQLGAGRRSRRI